MSKTGILIVEDGKAIKNLIATTLEVYDYHYTWADKGEQGILSVASQRSGIILLDLGLPSTGGVDVVRKIHSWSKVPVIAISARSEDDDKTATPDAGADDYFTRPFSVDELLVGFRTTQRRLNYIQSPKKDQSSTFIDGGLTINYMAGYATLDDEEPHLAPYEYKLLCLLAHDIGKVLTHSHITRKIQGVAWGGDIASLRAFMASFRKKIERTPLQPQYIQTRVGVGYRMLRQ